MKISGNFNERSRPEKQPVLRDANAADLYRKNVHHVGIGQQLLLHLLHSEAIPVGSKS